MKLRDWFSKKIDDQTKKIEERSWTFPVAPVLDHPERPDGCEYRRENDDYNVIRIWRGPGRGRRKIVNYMSVAGTSFRREAVCSFIRGKDRRVYLKHDPDNPVNPAAVAVWGKWRGATGGHEQLLGYVPDSNLDQVTAVSLDQLTVELEAMFAPVTTNDNPGLKVTIWQA